MRFKIPSLSIKWCFKSASICNKTTEINTQANKLCKLLEDIAKLLLLFTQGKDHLNNHQNCGDLPLALDINHPENGMIKAKIYKLKCVTLAAIRIHNGTFLGNTGDGLHKVQITRKIINNKIVIPNDLCTVYHKPVCIQKPKTNIKIIDKANNQCKDFVTTP